MKRINLYPFTLLLAMFAFVACEKDRAFPEWTDTGYGAIPRCIDCVNGQPAGSLDPDDVDGSGFNFTVEFYDDNQGRNVASYAWDVTYGDLGPVNLVTVNSSDFSTNADGLPQASIEISFRGILDALGIGEADLVIGQSFELDATLTKTDGSTFTSDNTSANLQGQPLFSGLFSFRGNVDFQFLNGEFDITATARNIMAGIGWDDCEGNTWTGTGFWEVDLQQVTADCGVVTDYKLFTINDAENKVEDASLGTYYSCYTGTLTDPSGLPLGDLRIHEECDKLSWAGASQWGEVYTFTALTVDGTMLTFEWENDYGEAGKVELVRKDGEDWPDLTF